MCARKSAGSRQCRVPLRFFFQVLLVAFAILLPATAPAAEENLSLRVVLLANSDDPDSLRIARHYAEVRGVPQENIIALKLPLTETITWREFVVTLWEPLLDELMRTKWLDATPMALTDAVGRRKLAVYSHRIAALVTCRGVPLRIENDATLYTESPFTQKAEFRINSGAVDSELSLLAHPNYPINAFVPNPLFQSDKPGTLERLQIVKVSRLDGPTVESALGLVDLAVTAERTGLLGRAYVDLGGPHAIGERWLDSVVEQLTIAGFAPAVDREPATMPATARFDAPVLYFGWYSGNLDGPFALPGFRFPPGAVALHIHSFSATTLRSTTIGWTGPLVARGVTATVGNVYEPYLELTHRPPLFLRALLRGATLVDAAYYALPELSWHAMLIGDPLYRPFAVPLDAQLKSLGTLPPLRAGYAALRRINELAAAGRRDEALALARSAQHDVPSVAVGLALSGLLRDAGDREGAASALGFVTLLKMFAADEWALVREVALQLDTLGHPARAVEVWSALFAVETLPRELRSAWLREAVRTARAAKDTKQASAWDHALTELAPSPVDKK